MLLQLLRRRRIHLLRQQTKYYVARFVPHRIPRPPPGIFVRLPPTVFRRNQRVMACEAREFRIFWPHIFFVVAVALPSPTQSFQRSAQLHGLPGAPIPHATPCSVLDGLTRRRLAGRLPMTGFDRRK